MTNEQKLQMAIDMCRRGARETDSPIEKEVLTLYADLLPLLTAWEVRIRETKFSVSDYLTALTGVCATIMASAARNAADEDMEKVNQLGPMVITEFARLFQMTCYMAPTVAQLDTPGNRAN